MEIDRYSRRIVPFLALGGERLKRGGAVAPAYIGSVQASKAT
jgi:hypothetical protein